MNLLENISLAINGLISNKMRALLTMLGIIIGIGSVIAITSVGNAMTTSVNDALANFGITNISVYLSSKEGGGGGSAMTKDDYIATDMIAKYQKKYADKITAIGLSASAGTGKIKNGHKTSNVSLSGVNAGSMLVDNITVLRGRFIAEKDEQRVSKVAVISERLVSELYGPADNPIGKQIRMETNYGYQTYTVVGVYQEASSSMFMRQDTRTTFYIPVTAAKELTGDNDGYQSLTVMAARGIDYTKFADDTQNYFNTFYAKNKFFQCFAMSLESQISEMNSVMGTLTLAISIIAAISLLVGGIGVMNIMLVSVTERTREIGVRKALGAPDSAIRTQFIVESMIICLIGGVFGIILGAGLGYAGGLLLKQAAYPTLSSIAVAVGFSMVIGIFFGYYPANKAAKLDPIEALRYE
ncbi:ABC transporter permease [Caproiciproducens sp. CPB-2]|uniref:ABC transporter permease n=1 Tax=unclassified Caproiciproducens TaxID=2643836 RepID=UPI0023DC17E3|nr:ABC transporter permease [Caproiciproducens sp. CPB-2]MDF1494633.1 ABC transporter permease [Caproiciproducens sp. CPB-2]